MLTKRNRMLSISRHLFLAGLMFLVFAHILLAHWKKSFGELSGLHVARYRSTIEAGLLCLVAGTACALAAIARYIRSQNTIRPDRQY